MAQHDYDIANASGASVRADLNAMADAMVSNNSGGTEPTTKFSYMWWADTTTGLMKQRNGANNAWLTRGSLTSSVVPAFESTGINDNATSTAVTVDSSGNVLVGTTTPFNHFGEQPLLTVNKISGIGLKGLGSGNVGLTTIPAANTQYYAGYFLNSSGTGVGYISVTSTATAYNTSSDYRLKTNVTPMSGATAAVKLLKPCNFDWIADGSNVNGFLAHELAEVVPEAATGTKDAMIDEEYEVTPATETTAAVMGTRSVPDMQGIDQAKIVPLLTATIQEMLIRIEALEGE